MYFFRQLENLLNYITKNKLTVEDFLFVGFIPTLLKNKLKNINFSAKLTQTPHAVWVGKLSSCIVNNNINFRKSKIAFDEFKPIYVKSAEIN